jgi:hypothetical protein
MMDDPSAAIPARRSFRAHLAASCIVLVASIWLSSGTLSPHVLTAEPAHPHPPCGYLYSIDHPHHVATTQLLSGAPRAQWEWGAFLRRILFAILAFPFMRWLGFETGGFVASVLLHLVALLAFAAYVRRTIGERGAIAAAWLVATYPGIPYWGALPYCYSAIVPCSLLIYVLLCELARAERFGRASLLCGAMGMLFTAYDFLPLFGAASLFVLAARRRWRWIPAAGLLLVFPVAVWNLVLWRIFRVAPINANTGSFRDIVLSWLNPADLQGWRRLLADLPRIAVENYLDSGFWVLPVLFAVLLVADRLGPRVRLALPEKAVLWSTLLLFLFNNAAPPYSGWQLRGDWIARFYQPVFVAYVSFAARAFASTELGRSRRTTAAALCAAILIDASVAFGAILHIPYAGTLHYRFYRHSPAGTFDRNLARYGRRPLGFCKS